MSAQRNHSRTKVSRFKSGRATSSLSRESMAKTARERICTMRAYIVWPFVIMHATFVNIFSVSVGSHSMTQTRVSRRAFWLRRGNYRLSAYMENHLDFPMKIERYLPTEIERYLKRYFNIKKYWYPYITEIIFFISNLFLLMFFVRDIDIIINIR